MAAYFLESSIEAWRMQFEETGITKKDLIELFCCFFEAIWGQSAIPNWPLGVTLDSLPTKPMVVLLQLSQVQKRLELLCSLLCFLKLRDTCPNYPPSKPT